MKVSRFPDAIVLIFFLILGAQLISYVLPSGRYERITVDGHEQVLPGTFQIVQSDPLPVFAALTAIPRGMVKAVEIVFFVLVIGGALAVIRATGVIDAALGSVIAHFGRRPNVLIAGCLTMFALGSSTIGMAEEYLPFIPVLVAMCLALKMDAVVAIAMVYVGAGIGYGCAALNPFTVVIAQRIAGIPIYSGQMLRWGLLVICLLLAIHHISRYSRRVSSDPTYSLVADCDFSYGFELPDRVPFTRRRSAICIVCFLALVLFVFGVAQKGWFLTELSALFFGLICLVSILGRLSPNCTAHHFSNGAAQLTPAALVIGFARSIEVVLDDAMVKDTIIHGVASTLDGLPAVSAAVGMLVVQTLFNLLIPSGSAQAFVTMPIMAPLADLTGVGREVAVLAYQFGDGFTNMVTPTNAVLMGMLSLSRVPYARWFRFVLPLLGKIYLVAVATLIVTVSL